jgi:SAM-dependent methyltransferase
LQKTIERERITGIRLIGLDLDQWHPVPESYGLALMTYFWDERVFRRARDALRPGGHLILRTFVVPGNLLGPRHHYVELNSPLITEVTKGWPLWWWEVDQVAGIVTMAVQKPL